MAVALEPNSRNGKSGEGIRRWVMREYQPEDVEGIRELSTAVFHDTRPTEHFTWKLEHNPAGRIGMIAEHSGRIVGFTVFVPMRLRIGNELILGVQGADSMTHPDHQGIFVPLQKACMESAIAKGFEVAFGLPNEYSYPALVLLLNWDHTGDVPRWIRVLNTDSAFLASLSRPKKIMAEAMRLFPMGNRTPSGIEIRRERPSDEELVSLANRATMNETARMCRVEHSADWFRWRFDSASQRRYQWFSAYVGRDLKAWAAFGLNDWGELPLIGMSGTDRRALEAVVSLATRHAKELRLGVLMSVTNSDSVIRALKSCGYLQYRRLPLVVKSLTNRILNANIHYHSSWRVSSEDLDTF